MHRSNNNPLAIITPSTQTVVSKNPSSMKGTKDPWKNIPDFGQAKFTVSLDYFVPESKEVFKN